MLMDKPLIIVDSEGNWLKNDTSVLNITMSLDDIEYESDQIKERIKFQLYANMNNFEIETF